MSVIKSDLMPQPYVMGKHSTFFDYKKFLLCIIFIFLPIFSIPILRLSSLITSATHEAVSEFGIVLFAMFFIRTRKENHLSALLIGCSFLAVSIADILFYITTVKNSAQISALVYTREILYSVYLTSLFSFFVNKNLKYMKDAFSIFLAISVFITFGWLSYTYILIPFYARVENVSIFNDINSTYYAFLEAAFLAIAIPIALRERKASNLFFIQIIVFQFIGDYGIRYLLVLNKTSASPIFECTWQFSMAGMLCCVLYNKQLPFLEERLLATYKSIRALLALLLTVGMATFIGFMSLVRLYTIGNAFDITYVLLGIYMSFLAANLFAHALSNYIISIRVPSIPEYDSNLTFVIPAEEISTSNLYELNSILLGYNELVLKFNNIMNILIDQSRSVAIAKTTQMLAHDVRKPFSILKMGLEILNRVKNMSELTQMLREITPEVDRAMTSVNGMINDVMEIGRTSAPQQEPVSAQSLIESSLNEIGRMYNASDITFSYELKHAHMLFVDPLKIGRVFSNILGNAIQAMNGKGRLWIATSEDDEMITFCLGNNGSVIASEDLPRLFEAFFTKDKKGGTGLGLAIAQKVVRAHGGKIWCESSAAKKTVEFFFTLPACKDMLSQSTAQLPENSKAIIERYQKALTQIASSASINTSASSGIDSEQLEKTIRSYAERKGRLLTVAVIDDEAIYRNALMGLIDGAEGLKGTLAVEMFSNSQQLLDAYTVKSYDFLICDIDLGRDSLNGYEIVKTLRDQGHQTAICIHSNRSLPEDYSHSVEVGAQAFLPKPLSHFHLLKFIGGVIAQEDATSAQPDPPSPEKPTRDLHSEPLVTADTRDHIIYVDDEKVYRTYAPSTISDARVSTYQTPEEVISIIENNPNFLNGLSAIITDQYFGKLSTTTGLEFAAILRTKYRFKNPIIINSNEVFTFADLKDKADLCLPKKLKSWAEMKKMLPASHEKDTEPPLVIARKPHNELTAEERASFAKLRHNVRGALGGIELIVVNMKPNEMSEALCDKLTAISAYLPQLMPYFPHELISELTKVTAKLTSSAPMSSADFTRSHAELIASVEKLKYHHYFVDDWWQFDPNEQAKKAKITQEKARKEHFTHEIAIHLADKDLEQQIMTYATLQLDTTIMATKDPENLAPIVVTDCFDLCSAASDLDLDVLMVEEDAIFATIIKKLKFKLSLRSRSKNEEHKHD